MVKIAINGFGRIGRMVFRAALNYPEIEVVALNDLTNNENLAYLLKYDSVHGKFNKKIDFDKSHLIVDGKSIKVLNETKPTNLPWKELDVDVVIESTGRFTQKKLALQHIEAGAKKVIVSAPCKCDGDETPVKTIVMGVNEHELTNEDVIISNASCTTNCLAPMVKILEDNFGIVHGLMTTIHAVTGDQRTVDAPHKKDFRRGRSALTSIIPTSTGAAKAIGEVLPALKGKLDGMAMRVPIPDGSVTDLTCKLKKSTTVEEIHKLFNNVAEHHMKNILRVSKDAIVSADIVTDPHSCIFDSKSTKLIDGDFVKVVGWYDNEWGYSNRMIDMVLLLAK